MSPVDTAVLVALSILIIAGWYLFTKGRTNLRGGLASWAQQIDPECDDPTKNPVPCAPMLSGPLGPPPPAKSGALMGSPTYDAPTAIYAVRLTGRFIAYLGTGDTTLITMANMTAPSLSFTRRDTKMALAATWASLDGYSAVVAIRGTKTVEDFRLDLKYHEVRPTTRQVGLIHPAKLTLRTGDEKVIQVHNGMYSAYTDVRDSLFAALPTGLTSRGTGNVFISGHSMGAAIAYYYALELAAAYPNLSVRVVGLAPPRAGDSAFAEKLMATTLCTSIINLADFVPSMPWSYMPDVIPPYTPDEYAHVSPIFAFNNHKADITACHGMLAYFEGVTSTMEPALIPSL